MAATLDQPLDGETDQSSPLRPLSNVALGLAAIAVLMLSFIAVTAYQLDGLIDRSLPCAPVLTNTDTIIDPAGYHLYSDELVEQSKAWEACMDESRQLFEDEAVNGRASFLYTPLPLIVAFLAVGLLGAAWVLTIIARSGQGYKRALGLLTVVSIAAFSFQLIYADTIRTVTEVVE